MSTPEPIDRARLPNRSTLEYQSASTGGHRLSPWAVFRIIRFAAFGTFFLCSGLLAGWVWVLAPWESSAAPFALLTAVFTGLTALCVSEIAKVWRAAKVRP